MPALLLACTRDPQRNRIRSAAFPVIKTLDDFQLSASSIPKAHLRLPIKARVGRRCRECRARRPTWHRQEPCADRTRARRRPRPARGCATSQPRTVERLFAGLADNTVGKVIDALLRHHEPQRSSGRGRSTPHRGRLVGDLEAWLDVVKEDRNHVAHRLGRRSREDAPHQYFLAESLYWLYVLCILRHCSAPVRVFSRIEEHQHMIWLAPKIAAAVQQWQAKRL